VIQLHYPSGGFPNAYFDNRSFRRRIKASAGYGAVRRGRSHYGVTLHKRGAAREHLEIFLADERCIPVVAMDTDDVSRRVGGLELLKFEQERRRSISTTLRVQGANGAAGIDEPG